MIDEGGATVRVVLLRHGQVANHRGDVPLTDLGRAQAQAAGEWLATQDVEVACLLSGETLRTRETADVLAEAYRGGGGEIPEPIVSFALRNPDFYLGGHRVNMGEGSTFMASQSPNVTEQDVESSTFYGGLMNAKDRVGFWLEHGNPPGDTARAVGMRIDAFARSLADVADYTTGADNNRVVLAVTHSPVLRAVRYHHWGAYTREPPFLHGYELTLNPHGELAMSIFTTDTGDIPATSRPGPGVIREEKD